MRSVRRRVGALALGLTLLVLLGTPPLPVDAQRIRSLYRVGVVNDARAANHPTVNGLKAGLRDLGLQEGRDVVFDVRLTDGTPSRMSEAAGALVKAGADILFTSGEAATRAVKAATHTTPIVFTLVGDPVAAGFVTSLAHPAGNVTGVSSLATTLLPKRLEALKALAPQLRRVWAVNVDPDLASPAMTRALEVSSRFGLEIMQRTIRSEVELAGWLEDVRPGDALVVPDIAAMDLAAVLLEISLARRVPAVFSAELWVNHGGLVAYGADYRAQGVQAARLVAKILRGAQPRDLPVEGAERIVLALNLKTAAAFGLTAPRQLLFQADVIHR